MYKVQPHRHSCCTTERCWLCLESCIIKLILPPEPFHIWCSCVTSYTFHSIFVHMMGQTTIILKAVNIRNEVSVDVWFLGWKIDIEKCLLCLVFTRSNLSLWSKNNCSTNLRKAHLKHISLPAIFAEMLGNKLLKYICFGFKRSQPMNMMKMSCLDVSIANAIQRIHLTNRKTQQS